MCGWGDGRGLRLLRVIPKQDVKRGLENLSVLIKVCCLGSIITQVIMLFPRSSLEAEGWPPGGTA